MSLPTSTLQKPNFVFIYSQHTYVPVAQSYCHVPVFAPFDEVFLNKICKKSE